MKNNIDEIKTQEDIEHEKLLNTIKMEPIIEKTEIKEEVELTSKKKKNKVIDYILIGLIAIILAIFIGVVIVL